MEAEIPSGVTPLAGERLNQLALGLLAAVKLNPAVVLPTLTVCAVGAVAPRVYVKVSDVGDAVSELADKFSVTGMVNGPPVVPAVVDVTRMDPL
jgi:hypothetical protein